MDGALICDSSLLYSIGSCHPDPELAEGEESPHLAMCPTHSAFLAEWVEALALPEGAWGFTGCGKRLDCHFWQKALG
jgi:hypothetical protein